MALPIAVVPKFSLNHFFWQNNASLLGPIGQSFDCPGNFSEPILPLGSAPESTGKGLDSLAPEGKVS